jgi:glyoxylase-like metal-dependent hydrolase (beta-lactamase superfamily II)
METPSYRVTNWAEDGQSVTYKDEDLYLQIFHTPGHTADEIALWDQNERVLYVGDTMYEWAPIYFPKEGNIIEYSTTIEKLKGLVRSWNLEATKARVKIACGHNTYDADAEDLLGAVDSLLYHVVQGLVESGRSEISRDELTQSFEGEDGKISFLGPVRLFEDFRNDPNAMDGISGRQY